MIDWQRVKELKSEMGDGFDEIVEVFLDEVDEVVARLRAGDRSSLAADMHFLKGASLNLGFARLADLCGQGESRANAGDPVDVDAVLACFSASRGEFLDGINRAAA
ncbi:MAG: Hpt domain-containing protein [Paracoccaceae bacterium]